MITWNGKEVKSAISRGGVKVLAHPYDNLVCTGCRPWPPPEIIQKLYQSRQVRAFSKDQLQLRGELLQKFGEKIFPNHSLFAVVGIGLHPDSFIDTTPDGVQFRSITWANICGLKFHPVADEVHRYYGWKKSNSKMFRSNSLRTQATMGKS